jgi:hypothetical protein
MKSGNHVPEAGARDGDVREPSSAEREASRQVRDIQELIAKLEVVTKRLAYPLRVLPQPRRTNGESPKEPDKTDGGAPG